MVVLLFDTAIDSDWFQSFEGEKNAYEYLKGMRMGMGMGDLFEQKCAFLYSVVK